MPIYVTNGFASYDAIKKLSKYMAASLITIFDFANENFYKKFGGTKRVDQIFDTLIQLEKQKIFMEIANWVVESDGAAERCEKLANWVVEHLGSHVPFHLLQFYSEDLPFPATSLQTLEKCADVAKKTGLRYVYISNLPHPLNNTFCYNCSLELISREVSKLKRIRLVEGRCPNCGFRIDVVE